jgi:hypothetical protein
MKPVFVVYGRMNPPTIGHKALIDVMLGMASAAGGDAVVVVSHTQDLKKNPLSAEEKMGLLRQIYPDERAVRIMATSKAESSIGHILTKLKAEGYTDLTLVLGSDRIADFQFLLKPFPELKIVSGGERDPDAEDEVAAMSATKVRAAALAGNWNSFRRGINTAVLNANLRKTMKNIRNRLTKKGGLRRTKSQRNRNRKSKRTIKRRV